MKSIMYTIYDSVAKTYGNPFYLMSDAVALRTAAQLARDPESQISKNPADYTLWRIGTFNPSDGYLDTEEWSCIAKFHELPTPEEAAA